MLRTIGCGLERSRARPGTFGWTHAVGIAARLVVGVCLLVALDGVPPASAGFVSWFFDSAGHVGLSAGERAASAAASLASKAAEIARSAGRTGRFATLDIMEN